MTSVNTKDEVFMVKNEEFYNAKEVSLNSISFKVMADMDSQTSALTVEISILRLHVILIQLMQRYFKETILEN